MSVVMEPRRPITIAVDRLTKVYPHDLTPRSIAAYFFGRGASTGKTVLSDITFTIPKGEVVGLIGQNGAGKSTLLRLIAGHATASAGEVHTSGKVQAILDIAPGLQDERSGRDNIRYVAAMYGMNEPEIDRKEAEIIEFAQLGRFIDYPIRTYSTGMRARLAFSLVTSVEADILLIDEALSVGDAGFAQRCRERMRALCRNGLSAIIVSHSMTSIRELCDRVLWLDEGRLVADGSPEVVVEDYRLAMLTRAEKEFTQRFARRMRVESRASWLAIEDLAAVDTERGKAVVVTVGAPFLLEAMLRSGKDGAQVSAILEFIRIDGILVLRCESPAIVLRSGFTRVAARFGPMQLGRFVYECRMTLVDAEGASLAERITVIAVQDHHHSYNSTYYQPIEWEADTIPAPAHAGAPLC